MLAHRYFKICIQKKLEIRDDTPKVYKLRNSGRENIKKSLTQFREGLIESAPPVYAFNNLEATFFIVSA